jgi:hypothetical protein
MVSMMQRLGISWTLPLQGSTKVGLRPSMPGKWTA